MKKTLSKIWKLLNKPLIETPSAETVKTTVESSKAVLELGKTLQEQGTKLEHLKPLIEQSDSLLGVLCSPEVQLVGAALPFVSIGVALLKYYREKTRTEPNLEDCVAIVSQAAYLASFQEIILSPEYKNILNNWNSPTNTEAVTKQLKQLGEFEFDAKTTRRIIASFPDSPLAKQFNQVLLERLHQVGVSENQAQILIEKVVRNSKPYFEQALAEFGDSVKKLADLYRNGSLELIQKNDSIDKYVEEYIASKPEEKVFNEKFSFKDIYVPPKARKVDKNGKLDTDTAPFDLATWAKSILLDTNSHTQSQVMFIQGGPGRGKSVFCRMFADWVRQYLHPAWTPILIRLRDIEQFQPSLEATLRSRITYNFTDINDHWLKDAHTRFLFILDGFDELRIERSNNQSVERFLRQVGTFQNDCYESKAMGHRVIITGRQMALHGIDRLPQNLERVEIAEMDAELQNQWFDNWYKQFSTYKTIDFKEFLQNNQSCPNQVKELAKEPLLLYMLTAMHRDDTLDINKFEQATETEAKILVYEQALDWVLTKQRSDDRHGDLNYELTRQNPEALRRILAEAAVCVVQSGGESASMQMVKVRLQQDDEAKGLIAEAEKELGEEALTTALCAFYLKPNEIGGVEFFHKSIREFLCAERIKQSLEKWKISGNDQKLDWEIYDLLGYGGLTPEIVEYLMGLLITSKEFRPVELSKRLENFYGRWCNGEFIDTLPPEKENLPQKKMQLLQKQTIKQGLRQIDIYAGLNVMILLLELHRYAQGRDDLKKEIIFYPSGKPQENTRTSQLLRIINYSDGIQLGNFTNVVGQFLSHANLIRADLSGANLSSANLRDANLCDANLRDANLRDADLIGTDLIGTDLIGTDLRDADLSGANLSGADLSGANLIRADLSGADLSGADLSGANLSGANLSGANLSGANLSHEIWGDVRWDENTNWENVQGLDTAIDVPEALKQQLGLS